MSHTAEWEKLVKSQLKTDDIAASLSKENLEGLKVQPYYSGEWQQLPNLLKVEESTQLVSKYSDSLDYNVFAVLIDGNVEGLFEKSVFIDNADLAVHIMAEEENTYYSLAEPFDSATGEINALLVRQLLEKDFRKNLCVDVAFHQNCGASITQQLGIALAKTKDLLEEFGEDLLPKILYRIAVGPVYFFEIAKLRAFRLLFAQLAKEYGKDDRPYIFAETSLRNKAKNDEENNLIRSTLEVAAAMIGGADAVYCNSFKMENSSSLSEEISFKQQIVLAYESIINVFEDAGNGSYYIADLTRQISEKAWQYFLEIEEDGGYTASMKSGKIQQEIYAHATAEQRWVEEGRIKVIGVNLYPKLDKTKSVEDLYPSDILKPVRWAEMFE